MKTKIAFLYDSFLERIDVRDRRQMTGFWTKDCFTGSEAVDAFIGGNIVSKREEAVYLIRRLQKELRLFRPIRGNHRFQDGDHHVYRRTIPYSLKDGSVVGLEVIFKPAAGKTLSLDEKATIFFQLAEVGDHKRGLKKYYSCFVGCDVVDRLVYCGVVETRKDAVLLGRSLARDMELFDHVLNKNYFTDDESLYSFTPGVLKIIYELENRKEGSGTFQSKKVKSVVSTLQSKEPASTTRLNAFGRLLRRLPKNFQSSKVNDTMEEVSEDDISVLSAPEMSQSRGLVEDGRESLISHSTSFDTLNDIILKHGGLQKSDSVSLYSTFEDSYGFAQDFDDDDSKYLHLGGASNIEEDETRIRYNFRSPPPLADEDFRFDNKSLLSAAPTFEDSPRSACSFKVLKPHTKLRKDGSAKPLSLPQVQSTLYILDNNGEDDMTQITMDNCILTTAGSSEQDEYVVTLASTEEEISQLLASCGKPVSKSKSLQQKPASKDSPSTHHEKARPISCPELSHQLTSSFLSTTSSQKQRIGKILRKDLWSCDEDVVCLGLDELCEFLLEDLAANGAHVVCCGGVMALKRILEEYVHVEAIQYHGCFALGQLALLDLETRTAISEMDGIPLVVQSMQYHVDSPRLQDAGRSALASICWRSDI